MCRNTDHGGRRCPSSHLQGEKKNAYNARRRARYAAGKLAGGESLSETGVITPAVKAASEEGGRRGKVLLEELDAEYQAQVSIKRAGGVGGGRGKKLLADLDDKYSQLAEDKATDASPVAHAFVPGLDLDLDPTLFRKA